jgi:hypothetical protein
MLHPLAEAQTHPASNLNNSPYFPNPLNESTLEALQTIQEQEQRTSKATPNQQNPIPKGQYMLRIGAEQLAHQMP